MKKIHLSKFQKFIIKHESRLSMLFVILWIICSVALHEYKTVVYMGLGIAVLLTFSVGIYSEILHRKATGLYKDALNPSGAYGLICEFIDLINLNRNPNKFYLYFDLMLYCLTMGNYTGVIDICTKIRREYKSQKAEDSYDISVRLFLSTAYLYQGEKSLYDKEIEYIDELIQKRRVVKFISEHQYTEVKLIEESLYGEECSDYEERVLDFLYGKKANGKNKKPNKMQFISAYGILLNYYKRLGNSEKAKYYAEKILEIGNEQLVFYRTAKEYLENANKSN